MLDRTLDHHGVLQPARPVAIECNLEQKLDDHGTARGVLCCVVLLSWGTCSCQGVQGLWVGDLCDNVCLWRRRAGLWACMAAPMCGTHAAHRACMPSLGPASAHVAAGARRFVGLAPLYTSMPPMRVPFCVCGCFRCGLEGPRGVLGLQGSCVPLQLFVASTMVDTGRDARAGLLLQPSTFLWNGQHSETQKQVHDLGCTGRPGHEPGEDVGTLLVAS